MQEVFEKIIENLEEAKGNVPVNRLLDDIIKDKPKELGQLMAYDKAIEIVKQEAEQCNNGWIPCSERLPETNESVLCWAKSTARGGDVCFVGSCHNGFWFLQSSADTHSFPGQYVIVAWHPIEPYQQKGE